MNVTCATKSPSSCDSSTPTQVEESFAHNIRNTLMVLLFRVQTSSNPLWMKPTWRESRSLITLPLIHSVTKKVLTIPHDAQAGHHCHPCATEGDENAKQAGLRGSTSVLDRFLYLAACRTRGLLHILTRYINKHGFEGH